MACKLSIVGILASLTYVSLYVYTGSSYSVSRAGLLVQNSGRQFFAVKTMMSIEYWNVEMDIGS